jgi:hypothetical protein
MLDVHVLVSRDTPQPWVSQCISSVRVAARLAPFPVDVHIVQGSPGHIGCGRTVGYALGSHPRVTCVDDDDIVLPEAFCAMAGALAGWHRAISVRELEMRNDAFRVGGNRHHLSVYRREDIIDHAGWANCGDVAQTWSIPDADWHDLPDIAYIHRVYETSKARLMRRADPTELRRANEH